MSDQAINAYLSIVGPGLERMIEQVASTPWREVCAKRARKLRKRREMIQFSHHSKTGKARYIWMPYPWHVPNLEFHPWSAS